MLASAYGSCQTTHTIFGLEVAVKGDGNWGEASLGQKVVASPNP